MRIGLKKDKNSKLPSKKTMNLYQIELTDNSWQRVIPYAILIVIIVFAFARFGVFQRIVQMNELNAQVSKAKIQLEEVNKSIEDYDEIKVEYIRYTNNYMLEEEGTLVDRMRIIGLIGDHVSNIGEIKSYTIKGNTVSIEVIVDTLDEVRLIRKQLEAVDWVEDITVNTAVKDVASKGGGKVVASIVVNVIYRGEVEGTAGALSTVKAADGEGAAIDEP